MSDPALVGDSGFPPSPVLSDDASTGTGTLWQPALSIEVLRDLYLTRQTLVLTHSLEFNLDGSASWFSLGLASPLNLDCLLANQQLVLTQQNGFVGTASTSDASITGRVFREGGGGMESAGNIHKTLRPRLRIQAATFYADEPPTRDAILSNLDDVFLYSMVPSGVTATVFGESVPLYKSLVKTGDEEVDWRGTITITAGDTW